MNGDAPLRVREGLWKIFETETSVGSNLPAVVGDI